MTERKVRGLEDREAQERKNLLRDVRSPAHKLADALKNGTVQTCGVFGAGVCLFAFPVVATPFFGLGLFFFMLLSSHAATSSFVHAPSIGDRHLVAAALPVLALVVVEAYPAAFPSTPAASPSPFPIEALQMAYCCVQGR